MFGFKGSQESRLKEALKKLEIGNLKDAINELLRLAMEDYAEAEYWLADIYEFTLKDLQEAVRWYKRAAEHGHAKSKRCLANMYMVGSGTEFNCKEAFRLYHEAADQNIPEAQFVLGEYYRTGYPDLIEKNTDRALAWYEQAARAGYEHAKTRIEQFWPDGVFQDRQRATETGDERSTDQKNLYGECSELFHIIVEVAKRHEYIPDNEFPFVPELQIYKRKIVEFVCSFIYENSRKEGLDDNQMIAIFTYIFRQGFFDMRRWHESTDGKIGEVITSSPFSDKFYHQWSSPELRNQIDDIPVPEIVFAIMQKWVSENGDDLRRKGVDMWEPLTIALDVTYRLAVSIALKMFGYLKKTS
ncbi:MAG: tetratricopeptide repeat protein [Syntrophorhabdaceae bacterium]